MPYREKSGKWRGKVTVEKKIYTKLLPTKAEAHKWELNKKEDLTRKISIDPTHKIPPHILGAALESLRAKYKLLYENPKNTIATIFDQIMNEVELPVRFKDIIELAKQIQNGKRQDIPIKLRAEILERDNYTCQHCGRKAPDVKLHVDHIVPKKKGGLTETRNLQTLCIECNMGKSDQFYFHKKKHMREAHGKSTKSVSS